ncbi:hypothetical protein E3N88_05961 [Mikania micrantha]|uniref:ENT domain-containing protein n=1 Tax=Mikania micrantha TaxID=192012 RepID=A0A5N6PP98_9ASTR|nr:hypothetical protein E3N88_05961 [Mikania micrantha]
MYRSSSATMFRSDEYFLNLSPPQKPAQLLDNSLPIYDSVSADCTKEHCKSSRENSIHCIPVVLFLCALFSKQLITQYGIKARKVRSIRQAYYTNNTIQSNTILILIPLNKLILPSLQFFLSGSALENLQSINDHNSDPIQLFASKKVNVDVTTEDVSGAYRRKANGGGDDDDDRVECSVGSCSINGYSEYNIQSKSNAFEDTKTYGSDAESTCEIGYEDEIHRLELQAYRCTIEALHASGPLTWEKETMAQSWMLVHLAYDSVT